MSIDDIVKKMEDKPWALSNGKNFLAKRWHCSPEDILKAKKIIRNKSFGSKLPKILIYDVETAPMCAYVWGRWKQNISLDATVSEWFMLCWSAKWLYSDEIIGERLTSIEAIIEDDSRIVKELWKLIDEADIVIAYNGRKADIPWMNTRFILNGLNPPSHYRIIDPCEVAKKTFGFSSNKLDALAGYFNISHKMETSFDLWKNCLAGDDKSLDYMLEYNKKDVKILEEVYLRMRNWIPNHPNISMYGDGNGCALCGSKDISILNNKYYYTSAGKYQLYKCNKCGGVFRGVTNLLKSNVRPIVK